MNYRSKHFWSIKISESLVYGNVIKGHFSQFQILLLGTHWHLTRIWTRAIQVWGERKNCQGSRGVLIPTRTFSFLDLNESEMIQLGQFGSISDMFVLPFNGSAKKFRRSCATWTSFDKELEKKEEMATKKNFQTSRTSGRRKEQER